MDSHKLSSAKFTNLLQISRPYSQTFQDLSSIIDFSQTSKALTMADEIERP